MSIMVFYKPLGMTSKVSDGRRYAQPNQKDVEAFCKETQEFANANDYRVISMTPVTGGLDQPTGGGSALTCGFVVVLEKP